MAANDQLRMLTVDKPTLHSATMSNILSFECEYVDGQTPALMPCIDGGRLADLVAEFEKASGFNDPAGGYGGIVPSYFNLGPLSDYFLGQQKPVDGDEPGEIYALFCDCGEAGCWPLMAHVRIEGERVLWDRFGQPHRPNRDYSGFGPFEFDRSAYQQAIEQILRFSVTD